MKFKLVFVLLFGSLLSGCTSKIEKQFMAGCEAGGAPSEVCECMYEKHEDKYGEDHLDYVLNHPDADFMNFSIETAQTCAREYMD